MPRKSGGRSASGGSSGAAGKTVFAFVLGAGAAAGYLYLHSAPQAAIAPAPATSPPSPVARARPPQPAPPKAPPTAPFGISEDVFEAGAHLYSGRCASCHGTPKRDAASTPAAPQMWRKARRTVSRQAPGDLYTEIAAGAPAKGMPAYASALTDTQIWQIALLLKNADGDLPDPVIDILNRAIITLTPPILVVDDGVRDDSGNCTSRSPIAKGEPLRGRIGVQI